MSGAEREWTLGKSKIAITVTNIPTLLVRAENSRLDTQRDMPTVLRVTRHMVHAVLETPSGRIVFTSGLDSGVPSSLVVHAVESLLGDACRHEELERAVTEMLLISVAGWLSGQLAVNTLIAESVVKELVPSGGAAR